MAVVTIPYKPREHQLEVHNNRRRYNVLVCHRRFGKTVLAINELIKGVATCKERSPRLAYIAPLYKQAKTVAWDYLKYYCRPIPGITINESELRVDFPNGGRITLYGADNPDSLRGIYLDGCVIDEVAQCPAALYGEVIRPALADRGGWVIFIGTPKGHDHFYQLYHKALKDPDWYTRTFKASDTDILNADELKAAKAQMTEAEYEQEFECSFEISDHTILIPLQLVQAAIGRKISYAMLLKVMGVDVGMSLGGDPSAIVVRQGGVVIHIEEFRYDDTIQIAGRVRERFMSMDCQRGFIDGISWGAGVAHTLMGWGLPFTPVNVAESAAEGDRFMRFRDELWWRGGEFFAEKQCAILPELELAGKLAAELSTPTYKYTPSGKIKVQGKDEIDESPNLADAFLLTLKDGVVSIPLPSGLLSVNFDTQQSMVL